MLEVNVGLNVMHDEFECMSDYSLCSHVSLGLELYLFYFFDFDLT